MHFYFAVIRSDLILMVIDFEDIIYNVDNDYCDVYRSITRKILSYALDKHRLAAKTPDALT